MNRRGLLALAPLAWMSAGGASAQRPSKAGSGPPQPVTVYPDRPRAPGRYAEVNGLRIYYEVHGKGRPLLLLHGGLMTIDALGPILPALADTRQVIAAELEGHGRTVDLDRPLSFEQMADDLAGLLRQLGHGPVDVIGFSMGGGTAIRMAIDHPEAVRRLVAISAVPKADSVYPSIRSQWPGMTAESLKGTPMERAYLQAAPQPGRWPRFIDKIRTFMLTAPDATDAEIRAIAAPTLLIGADSDLVRPEAILQMHRLMGGAPEHGGMGPRRPHQMAILPGTTHFDILTRTELLIPVIDTFLAAA